MAMLALDFAGGRGISIADGADRLEAWSNGLQMFKSAPVFGIGYGSFSERNNDLTAHNSLVLCLAELGLVGSTVWVALLITTALGLNSIMRPQMTKEPTECQSQPPSAAAEEKKSLVPTHWIMAVHLALISFMTTSWFLSRSYSITMYLVLGLATATIAIQRSAGEIRDHNRWVLLTITTEAAAILFIYGAVRLR
jgi:putative inorganic carbon (HCO3(-)) transporter